MSIKRGVSFYSWQQEQFFGRMNWKDMIRETREQLHTDGVEIINQQTIKRYPFPTDEFIYDWNNEMARYNMTAVTMDVYLDTMRFRNHVMNYAEAAELLKMDIVLAKKMGFRNVRCLSAVPLDVIKLALNTAEKYDVRIGKEIHSPNPADGQLVNEIVDFVQKSGTKHVGLVPDMGIFMKKPPMSALAFGVRSGAHERSVEIALECANVKNSSEEYIKRVKEEVPEWNDQDMEMSMHLHMLSHTDASLLEGLVPYIISIHGKFYEMTEIPGKPGNYEDIAFEYSEPINYLKKGGYEGYINSEYEGQRNQQDRGMEFLANEVEEVRRQHEMLARLIGE
jgi:hypothetical protein